MFDFLRAPEWGGIQGLLGILALWISVLPYVPWNLLGFQTQKDEPQLIKYTCLHDVRLSRLIVVASNEELVCALVVIWFDPVMP